MLPRSPVAESAAGKYIYYMVDNQKSIQSIVQAHACDIKAAGVRRLGLFGSFVRNEQRPESDVDILAEFEPGKKNYDNFIRLCELLEDLFKRPVEVVTPESLSPYIGPRIMQELVYVNISG